MRQSFQCRSVFPWRLQRSLWFVFAEHVFETVQLFNGNEVSYLLNLLLYGLADIQVLRKGFNDCIALCGLENNIKAFDRCRKECNTNTQYRKNPDA